MVSSVSDTPAYGRVPWVPPSRAPGTEYVAAGEGMPGDGAAPVAGATEDDAGDAGPGRMPGATAGPAGEKDETRHAPAAGGAPGEKGTTHAPNDQEVIR